MRLGCWAGDAIDSLYAWLWPDAGQFCCDPCGDRLIHQCARVASFGSLGLIDMDLLIIGVVAGLATIPGNILGRKILKKLQVSSHSLLVDILTLGGGLNFLWMAIK